MIPDLPKDLVEEILCRVPATCLKRLRFTCKRWNRLFNDRRFARKHSDKAAKQFLTLMLTKDYVICPMRVDLHGIIPSVEIADSRSSKYYPSPFDISRVFHCDGLLLCTSKDESKIVVWNPFTSETRWIEVGNRFKRGCTFVLGYNQDDKSYKILSFCLCSKDSEIYEFNSDSWRILDDNNPGWSVGYSDQCVSLKGNTYFFATYETKTHLMSLSLLEFDFSSEKSRLVPLPYKPHTSYETASLSVVREEKLSLLLQRDIKSKTEIWVTNKIDETKVVVSWSKVLAFDLRPDLQISYDVSFLLDEEKKVVVCCVRWMDMEDESKTIDMIYVLEENNKVTQVDFGVDTTDGCWPTILSYVPSLVQMEQARCKRKRSD